MSTFRPIQTTNDDGVENYLQVSGLTYNNQYGISDNGYLKPFTTDTSVTGKPAYIESYTNIGQAVLENSGAGATSSGLNPYGINSLHEGLLWGTGYQEDNDSLVPDWRSVRTYGFKNPMQIVGWGYDIFGYPVPNLNTESDGAEANYISGISPESLFLGPTGTSYTSGTAGWSVPLNNFKAGPLDLRWDAHRGVWCGWHGGVQAGVITKASSGQTELNDPANDALFPEDLFYDVVINDGVASSILITGVAHIGPKNGGAYRVVPYASGDFCFVVNKDNKYNLWMIELPATEDCEDDTVYSLADGDPWGSNKLLDGTGLFSALASGGLPEEFGGNPLPTGMTGTLLIDGDNDGDTDGYLVFVSGILMFASGDTNHVTFNVGATGYDGGLSP